ncbi:MAG: glycosyltransferase family 4 protein [Betaproteobacteria bacterium]
MKDKNSAGRIAPANACRSGYLFVLPWDLKYPGGVNQVVSNLFEQIAATGDWAPRLFIPHWKAKRFASADITGKPHDYGRLRSPYDAHRPMLALLAFAIDLPGAMLRVIRLLRQRNIVTVNVHYPLLEFMTFALVRRLRLHPSKFIISVHGTDLSKAESAKALERLLFRFLYRSADVIVACSSEMAGKVAAFIPERSHATRVIHNGVDVVRWLRDRDQTFHLGPVLASSPYVLTIGKYDYNKGQDVLVHAFAHIASTYPDLKLVMIGAPGAFQAELKRIVQSLGLESRVCMLESVPNSRIPVFMERAKIFVLPSRQEAFGIVLLEAAAAAIPVIASRIGGVPEVVGEGCALLVPPQEPAALAAALRSLLEDPVLSRSLAKAFNRRVRERFTWQAARDRYLELVSEVMAVQRV